jgi:hypothetical protein
MNGARHLVGVVKASHSTSVAISSGSPSRISVAVSSGMGWTLKVTSHMTASVPQLPASPRHRSRPVTFFITRPPDLNTSPLPLTRAQAQQMVARGADTDAPRADKLVANTPAIVLSPASPPPITASSIGSNASI